MANRGGKVETMTDFIFLGGSKITADSDCSYKMKIYLLLRRKDHFGWLVEAELEVG